MQAGSGAASLARATGLRLLRMLVDREKSLELLDKLLDRALGGARKVSFSSATPPLVKISSFSSPRQECKKLYNKLALPAFHLD